MLGAHDVFVPVPDLGGGVRQREPGPAPDDRHVVRSWPLEAVVDDVAGDDLEVVSGQLAVVAQ